MQGMLRSFQKTINCRKGLTLIELIVSISIMSIILGSILFIFMPSVKLNNTLMHSYNINISRTDIIEIIKELGVSNALDFKLLNSEDEISGNDINWIKWEDNKLYFNNRVVYKTEAQDHFEVYFSKEHSNILVITIMVEGYEDMQSTILLHNLKSNLTVEENLNSQEKFTIFEWIPVNFIVENSKY